MSKIDVSRWGEFKVGDLFEQVKTKKIPFKALDLPQESNSVQSLPLVAAGIDSQGRNRYIEPEYATILQNCLTVSANGANSGAVFYQNSEFSILQDAYALRIVNDYKNYRKQNVYLYLASVLTNVLVNNDWTNKATWRKVQEKNIKLPITSTGQPDWQYMDSYIAKLATRAHRDVSLLNGVKTESNQINIDKWKEFRVGELFNVELTDGDNKPDNLPEGDVPLISTIDSNNGIVGHFESDTKIFPKGSITVDMFGHTFVQLDDFQTVAHGHVNVILNDLPFDVALYVAAIIHKVAIEKKYGFNTMLTKTRLQKMVIQLPVDSNGQPSWSTMQSIVRNLVTISRKNVTSLRSLVKM